MNEGYSIGTYEGYNEFLKVRNGTRQLELVLGAIAAVKSAAEEERKITHSKHIDKYYSEALDRLDVKLTGARAYADRVGAIGR